MENYSRNRARDTNLPLNTLDFAHRDVSQVKKKSEIIQTFSEI